MSEREIDPHLAVFSWKRELDGTLSMDASVWIERMERLIESLQDPVLPGEIHAEAGSKVPRAEPKRPYTKR